MIRLDELDEAIAECQGERNPNANTCVKLAAYYALKRELYGNSEISGYSYDMAKSEPNNIIDYQGNSEFADTIRGYDYNDILPIIEELVETVSVLLPRVYAGFLRNLKNL